MADAPRDSADAFVNFTVSRWFMHALTTLAVAAVLLVFVGAPLGQIRHNFFAFGDLRAFYCAAKTASAGFDPYRVEPIGTCERSLVGLQHTNFVVPAPLPGPAIAAFEPLARLAFPLAATLWCGAIAIAFFGLAIALTRLTDARYGFALLLLAPLGFIIPIAQGQLVPIAVVLLAAAALALRRGRDTPAALLAAAATIEPHIGLPVCIALFIGRPRARTALLLAAAAVAALTVRTVGWAGLIEYVGRVIPEHIASEARYDDQYSLTYLLTWLHVCAHSAIVFGQISYWLLAAGAIAAAVRLTRAANDVCFLLFVPMAASVLGGPYVHQEHLLAAVPLGFLLLKGAVPQRTAAAFALLLVAWPAKFVMAMLGIPGMLLRIDPVYVPPPAAGRLPMLADALWAARAEAFSGHAILLVAKIPSWIGLLALGALVLLRLRALRPARTPSRIEVLAQPIHAR